MDYWVSIGRAFVRVIDTRWTLKQVGYLTGFLKLYKLQNSPIAGSDGPELKLPIMITLPYEGKYRSMRIVGSPN